MPTTAKGRRPAAREATTVASPRKRKKRRKAHEASAVLAEQKRKRPRKRHKARAAVKTVVRAPTARTVVKAPKRRRKARASTPYMMEAPKRRRARKRRTTARAWHGDVAGHRKAAKKGARKRKRKTAKRRHGTREHVYSMSEARKRPRKRRAKHRSHEVAARSTSRRYKARASKKSSGHGQYVADLAISVISGGIGFILADGLDRFLATYDPSAAPVAGAAPPKDKFTSGGAGTLANTLNIAQSPNLYRIAAGIGMTALPAIGSVYVGNEMIRSSLQGAAIGAGVKLFATFWNNVVMGSWLKPNADVPSIQKSIIARLYPAEVAAALNLANNPPMTQVSSSTSGALSGYQPSPGYLAAPPAPGYMPTGVGAPDVGPFALSADSPYPNAAQALRSAAGLNGSSPYPSAQDALRAQAGIGGDSPYPSAHQALQGSLGDPAPAVSDVLDAATLAVSAAVPGIAPHDAVNAASQAITAAPSGDLSQLIALLQQALPNIPWQTLSQAAQHVHPHVSRLHQMGVHPAHVASMAPHLRASKLQAMGVHPAVIAATTPPQLTGGALPSAQIAHLSGVSAPPPASLPVTVPPSFTPGPNSYMPGPPPGPGPGPQARGGDCGCIGDDNPFLGFVGDEDGDSLTSALTSN